MIERPRLVPFPSWGKEILVVRRVALLALIAALSFGAAPPQTPIIPSFFDPHHRLPKPDLESVKRIRFLTTDDFPPFHFALPDGTLTGFDIDLARAICADLAIACTIQSRRFETLIPQIKDGNDDALIAAVANTPATRAELAFTAPYYTTPARFAVKTASPLFAMVPERLAGHTIGVEAGTAYEAYLRAFFPKAVIKTFSARPELLGALKGGAVEAVFGDAIALSLWLNGTNSDTCCAFRGGPFTESHYFGNGVSIATAKENTALRQALDFELAKLSETGVVADLYLKYFPIGFY